jgi:hypothetical protein
MMNQLRFRLWWFRTITVPMVIPRAVCRFIANRLPRRVIYWVGIRMLVEATTGKYGNVHPDSVTVMERLKEMDGTLDGK